MKISLTKNKLLAIVAVIAPISLSAFALYFFGSSAQRILSSLENAITEGKVAGAQIKFEDITNEIPIIPEAEIISLDTSNDTISITLEATKKHDEIRKFYEDYMYIHEWESFGERTYKKDNKEIKIDIVENVIRISLAKI